MTTDIPVTADTSSHHQATKTLAAGASVLFIGRLVSKLLQAIGQIALARLLGPETFGMYAVGWTLISIIPWAASLGLDRTVIRFGAAYRAEESPARFKGLILWSVGLSLLAGLLIGAATFVLAPWLAANVFHKPDLVPVLRWYGAAFVFAAGVQTSAAATRISKRMKDSVLSEDFMQPATNLLLIALFFLIGWQIPGVYVAVVISFALAFFISIPALIRLYPELSAPARPTPIFTREIWLFTIPVAFAGVTNTSITWSDRLLMGSLRPAAEVGIYQAASSVSLVIPMILGSFNSVFAPIIAELYHFGEMKRLDELFKITTKWGLYLCFPLFIVMWLQSHDVVLFVFGQKFAAGAIPLIILSFGQLINVGTGTIGSLLTMTGHQNKWLAFLFGGLFIEIALGLILIPRLGMVGAAAASSVSLIVLMVAGIIAARRLIDVWPYDGRYLKGLAAGGLAMLAVFLLRGPITPLPILVRLIIGGLTATAVFVVTILVLGVDQEDRTFIQSLWARVTRKGKGSGEAEPIVKAE